MTSLVNTPDREGLPPTRPGIPAARRGWFDTPLVDAELLKFRSMLTQAGSLLAAKSVKTALIRPDAVTSIWTFSSNTTETGEFASVAVTRRLGTELIIILTFVPASQSWDVSNYSSSLVSRYITVSRGVTVVDEGFVIMPMVNYALVDQDPAFEEMLGVSGANPTPIQVIDSADVEGDFTYTFDCTAGQSSGGADRSILASRITLLERKR